MRLELGETIVLQLLAMVVFSLVYLKRKKRGDHRKKTWVSILLYLYVAGLISVTVQPLSVLSYRVDSYNIAYMVNLVPFKEILKDIQDIGVAYGGNVGFQVKVILKNYVGNIGIFIPYGILLALLKDQKKSFVQNLWTGFLLSLLIELSQLLYGLTGYGIRMFDVDDLILNTLGYMIGYGLMTGLKQSKLYKKSTKTQTNKKVS